MRSFFLLPPKKDFSIDVRAPAGMTLLGYLFYAFSKTGEYEAVFIVSESLLRAFSGEPKLLRRFKESPGYQLFLKAAVQEEPTPKGRRDWLGERRSLEGNPRVGALLRHLFGKILPGWNRLGQASFLVELAKGARANCYFPRGYQRSLLLVSSERQKRRLEESGHWLRLFDL
ncbi:MAG: hypothetical protein MR428_08205, partial [Mesosutterella sp.]|nr:hypothetical protein [Mesosutterella sp.]